MYTKDLSFAQCGNIYRNLKKELGSNITKPPELPSLVGFHLINLFTAATTSRMREKILTEFCKDDSTLQLIITTSAFGLGVGGNTSKVMKEYLLVYAVVSCSCLMLCFLKIQ